MRPAHLPVLLLAGLATHGMGQEVVSADQLRQDARSGRTLIVLFSQHDCRYCAEARRYLVPLFATPERQARHILRQVDIDSDRPLTDVHGQRSTHRQFASQQRVRFTPTLVAYGPDGQRRGDPLAGIGLPEFYGQQVARWLDQLPPAR